MRFSYLCKFLIGLVLVLGGAFGSGCKSTPAPPKAGPAEVAVVTVQSERVVLTTELPGRISAYLVAEIRPQVSGLLQKRLFEEGTYVKEGEYFYQIDPVRTRRHMIRPRRHLPCLGIRNHSWLKQICPRFGPAPNASKGW